jgi:hypothetical protein
MKRSSFTASRARLGQIAQMAVGRLARRHRFMGVILLQHVHGEGDAAGEAQTFGDCFGCGVEQERHFSGMFQVPLGIGLQPGSRLFQSHMLSNAGDHVLQFALAGMMIQYIVDGDQWHARGPRHALQISQAAAVFAGIEHGCRQPGVVAQFGQHRFCAFQVGHDDEKKSVAMGDKIGKIEKAVAFGRA